MNLVGRRWRATSAVRGLHDPDPRRPDLGGPDGDTVILGIRPSDLEDSGLWRGETCPTIEVHADVIEELGSEVNVLFRVDAPPVETEETLAAASDEAERGDPAHGRGAPAATFCARVDARTSAAPGEPIRLTVDPARFHFFDPATGLAIDPALAPAAAG